jgi:hypothetical protein
MEFPNVAVSGFGKMEALNDKKLYAVLPDHNMYSASPPFKEEDGDIQLLHSDVRLISVSNEIVAFTDVHGKLWYSNDDDYPPVETTITPRSFAAHDSGIYIIPYKYEEDTTTLVRLSLTGEELPPLSIKKSCDYVVCSNNGNAIFLTRDKQIVTYTPGDEKKWLFFDDLIHPVNQIAISRDSNPVTLYGLVLRSGRAGFWSSEDDENKVKFIRDVDDAVGIGISHSHFAIVRRDGAVWTYGLKGGWLDQSPGLLAEEGEEERLLLPPLLLKRMTTVNPRNDALAVVCGFESTMVLSSKGRVSIATAEGVKVDFSP